MQQLDDVVSNNTGYLMDTDGADTVRHLGDAGFSEATLKEALDCGAGMWLFV